MFADTRLGVFAVDLNLDNISWAELDEHGNRIRGDMVCFSINETTGQNRDAIGKACREIMKICEKTNKLLAMEKLDLTKKKSRLAYGPSKANRGSSMFAYKTMVAFLEEQAFRAGIAVIKINPAYTSFIGKVKYMRCLRNAVHVSAAYVIGRRAMGFKERVPKYLKPLLKEETLRKHHWSQFATLSLKLKKIWTREFYRKDPVFS